jgi:P4 family phage/plasmid primase-like protien
VRAVSDGLEALAAELMAQAPDPVSGGKARQWSQLGGSSERTAEQQGADRTAGFLPQTDLGNAERWQLRHGRDFLHCPELGWLAWDGRRWSREDADTRLMDSVFDTVRAIQFEARARRQLGEAWRDRLARLHEELAKERIDAEQWQAGRDALGDDPDPVVKAVKGEITLASDKLAQWGRTSESQAKIMAIAGLAANLVAVRHEDLDANPMAFNVANGTLYFERVKGKGANRKFGPHRREDRITMLAPVVFDPDALCPTYDLFLNRVQPDVQVRQFLHAYAGYCLTGDTGEQKFAICHGSLGANGKSTWADVLGQMWGDYALTVNIAVFMDEKIRSGSAPSPDLAELPRKRLVKTSEPPRGAPFAESLVKLVTGGEPLPARQLNKPFFRFLPEFKILVSMNPEPELSSDAAIWRRTRIVPWDVTIPEAERDDRLKEKLMAEASGILNQLLLGLDQWAADGLPNVEAVMAATQKMRDTRDPLGRFLRLATDIDPGSRVQSTALYRVYAAWCLFEGEKPWSQKGFGGALRDKGFTTIQSSTVHYLGLKLVRDEGAFQVERDGGLPPVRREALGPRTDGKRDEWEDDGPIEGGSWEGFPE